MRAGIDSCHPQLFAGLGIECAEAAIVGGADEDQAARGGDRPTDIRAPGFLLIGAQAFRDSQYALPGDLAGVDVDGKDAAPWRTGETELRPTLVNELRFSYFFISLSIVPAGERDCSGCLGIGAPGIAIVQAGLYLGSSSVAFNLGRRFEFNDSMTWVRGRHRVRFGVDWEHNRGGNLLWDNDPVSISLFSPDQARASNANIPLPVVFRSLDDILQLPLQSFKLGIGDPRVPQENGGLVRTRNTLWLYFQDTWRLHERLTLNYGLGWSVDGNLNYDLGKPALLAPILGAGGLGPTRKQWKNFFPVVGTGLGPVLGR